jgi:O-antigen/teichoic acid export membrane protein
MASDLVHVVMNTMDAILLGHFKGTAEVAALRAVQPAAKLNQLVLSTFGLLFTPLAARMFARNDGEGIKDLYWQNAVWIAIISFPIFALTFSLAQPFTVLLYGTTYEESAMILALLSFGYYFNAALGPNGLTLKVFGKVRYIVIIDILAAMVSLGLNLLLIPRYGAVGAALGTCGTLFTFNVLKQAGLGLDAGMRLFQWRYLKVYLVIGVSTLGLLLLQVLMSLDLYVGFALAVLVSLLVLRVSREPLNVAHMFPELLRFRLASRLFGG